MSINLLKNKMVNISVGDIECNSVNNQSFPPVIGTPGQVMGVDALGVLTYINNTVAGSIDGTANQIDIITVGIASTISLSNDILLPLGTIDCSGIIVNDIACNSLNSQILNVNDLLTPSIGFNCDVSGFIINDEAFLNTTNAANILLTNAAADRFPSSELLINQLNMSDGTNASVLSNAALTMTNGTNSSSLNNSQLAISDSTYSSSLLSNRFTLSMGVNTLAQITEAGCDLPTITTNGYILPTAIGTSNQLLSLPNSGNQCTWVSPYSNGTTYDSPLDISGNLVSLKVGQNIIAITPANHIIGPNSLVAGYCHLSNACSSNYNNVHS